MVFAVVVVAGFVIVTSQRDQLYDQVDAQLTATQIPPELRSGTTGRVGSPGELRDPPSDGPPSDGAPVGEPAPVPPDEFPVDDENISDLYVAVLTADGVLRPRIEGQLLVDVPDVESLVADPPAEPTMLTTDGVAGDSTFRVLFLPGTDTTLGAVIALPTDDVDDAVRQLSFTFAGAAALVLLTLVLIAYWVSRFGLRPINAMTDVAEAISAGERDRRADVDSDTTEAGRLGRAFNVMLDEHDRSEERLRQFVSNASHELRTPLTSIRGYLDLYSAGGFRKSGELEDAVRRMQAEAERMNLLVDDLLVLAKFDEEQPLDMATVEVDGLARDVVALALAAHPERDITVDAPSTVEASADRLRLHQALAALVDNAVRHTPPDASICVNVTRSDGSVRLAVVDHGPGLSDDEMSAVFDRFTRGDASRARRTGGSGLGLSIARTIVRAHGGDITASATPGTGATFTIEIPDQLTG